MQVKLNHPTVGTQLKDIRPGAVFTIEGVGKAYMKIYWDHGSLICKANVMQSYDMHHAVSLETGLIVALPLRTHVLPVAGQFLGEF